MDPSESTPDDLLIREQTELSLSLQEAGSGDGLFNPDGTINVAILRPCNGRGPGQRIYEAAMLERDAGKFKGWPMFDNHDSPRAKAARNGFPRPPSELAGAIRESWWDPHFTSPEDAELGLDQGAVMGRCALSDPMEALVRKIPEVVKLSVNAQSTGMRAGSRNGKRGWIVEGIVADPENSSVDLVTKAGAGGRVASLLESLYDESNATGGHTAGHLLEASVSDLTSDGGDPMTTLQEALQSDEVKTFIGEQIEAGVNSKLSEALTEALPGALTAALQEVLPASEARIRADVGKSNHLRSLAGRARTLIEAAPLPEYAKAELLVDYGVTEGDNDDVTPGRSLRLIEAEVDAAGEVTKSAGDVLVEDIDREVKRARNLLRESAPTVPLAPGGGGDGGAVAAAPFGGEGSAWAARMRQKGLNPEQFGATKPAKTATT